VNIDELQQRLIATARANPPGDGVPYAFAQRVMARLADRSQADCWALWSRALWRSAAPCVAIMLLFCAWSMFAQQGNPPAPDLSQALDNTVLGAAYQDPAPDPAW
jgi:hypothetical protein